MRHLYVRLAAVIATLVGYWSPWLTHPAAALRLNGYELSEWITFLPEVRTGEMALSRLLFLLPLACLALLLALLATRKPLLVAAPPLGEVGRQTPTSRPASRIGLAAALPALAGPWAWLLLLAAALCTFVILPPYPYLITALSDPEFRSQFFVACATALGLIVVAYLPTELKDVLQLLLGVAGTAIGIFALFSLRPVASSLLNAAWPIGLGWLLMVGGFAILSIAALAQLVSAKE